MVSINDPWETSGWKLIVLYIYREFELFKEHLTTASLLDYKRHIEVFVVNVYSTM